MPYYEEALRLMRATGDRAAEGKTLSNLGVAYSLTGDKRTALELFDKAKQILREVQDRRALAEVCGNMGVTYDNLGEYQLALENHRYELGLRREMGDRAGEGVTQNNIGSAYSGLADYQNALDAYFAALEINRSNDHRWNMAINLNNIGWVYASLGDRSHALSSYQESLQLSRSINDRRRIAVALNNIANVHADLGNYRKAIALHSEALALRRVTSDPDGEASSLTNLGDAYAKVGETERAREHFEGALAILRVTVNRHKLVRTLRNLGTLRRKAGEYDLALADLDEALGISREIHDRNGEASVLAELARVDYDRGDLSTAHQLAEQSLAAFESLRLRVVSPSLRASLVASVRQVHELNIDILERLHAQQPSGGYNVRALRAAERGRARSLLDLLGESTAEIRRGVDRTLLARERELQRMIADKADRQIRLLNTAHSAQQAADAARELDSLGAEVEQVQSRIRETSPKYAALTQPAPLDLQDIQKRVLDRETVLLEYELGAERSFLWAVSSSSIASFELPPRAVIESAAKKVYELLDARNKRPAGESPEAWAARVRRSDLLYFGAADKVSRMLLGPVSSLIAKKRLLVVTEGALQYLPFAALPEPGKRTPLMVEHEIVTAPSASVIAVLRQETASRQRADKMLFVVADPVFSASDSRVAQQNTLLSRVALRPVVERGTPDFVRLRFSRAEAEEISRLAPAATTRTVFDFEASRETVMSPDISRYRIVHFATHSVLDNEHPDLSGVVLSLVDRGGRRQNGLLRLYDIYNLRLRADLVVLSACRTALGRDIKSEGLVGLTRGFFYAGSPRVLASLWEVEDRTTARLMGQFYQRILVAGETPAAALRAAQVAMWQTRGWDAPYYWAAFTLQGEWR
jgi:CHAT domain-containing protein/tetratricopeptide (TPR) repeat protein